LGVVGVVVMVVVTRVWVCTFTFVSCPVRRRELQSEGDEFEIRVNFTAPASVAFYRNGALQYDFKGFNASKEQVRVDLCRRVVPCSLVL
jgi:hypothetical protein